MGDAPHGWAFLVARGRRQGYRTILAPDFLASARLHGLLAESASVHAAGSRHQAEIDGPGVGPMTMVYETEQLTAAELGGDHAAVDEHGRPLEILYGIVSRQRLRGRVDPDDLRIARAEALRSYRRFLAGETDFAVDASQAFALRGVDARAPRSPAPRPARARRVPRAAPVAALAVVLALAVFARPKGGAGDPVTQVRAAAASAPAADCRVPVALDLTGTIAARTATDVTYHWETPAGIGLPRKLTFATAAAQTVSDAIELSGSPGREIAGTAVLVIDSPHARRADAPFRIECP
jgi:hypothetical protein